MEEDQLSDMSAWEDEPDMYKSDSELSDWSPEQAEPPVASASGADEDDAAGDVLWQLQHAKANACMTGPSAMDFPKHIQSLQFIAAREPCILLIC